jgi:hypothetical protein
MLVSSPGFAAEAPLVESWGSCHSLCWSKETEVAFVMVAVWSSSKRTSFLSLSLFFSFVRNARYWPQFRFNWEELMGVAVGVSNRFLLGISFWNIFQVDGEEPSFFTRSDLRAA